MRLSQMVGQLLPAMPSIGATTILGCIAVPAVAEVPGDRAWVQVGAFFPKVDSDMQIENDDFIKDSTAVDFERDLNLDDRKLVPKIEAGLRIANRFRLEAGYFNISRSASTTLSRAIVVDDNEFAVAAEVESELETRVIRVVAGYSFVRSERTELGIAVGAHVAEVAAQIASQDSMRGETKRRKEGREESAPLPNGGLYASYVMSDKLSIQARVDAFKLKVGHYDGRFVDAYIGVTARLYKNLGVGMGYAYSVYRLDVDKSEWDGSFKYRYWGPAAHLEISLR